LPVVSGRDGSGKMRKRFDILRWKKDFTVTGLETAAQSISIKCTPEQFSELVEMEGIRPAHYVAR
jgi:predicted DNA-binding protein (MmcQ/YjbR family)